ncbi:hypothetical protein TNCV_2439511 [Trichonephila clavipes]|nr:hypothetical protein TNCV_2439511 [Trichonephila clavipes]
MTTTSYRSRRRWVFVTFFRRGPTLLSGRVFFTRNDDNDILPQPRGGGCSSSFFLRGTTCGPVKSWCTRNDDNDILPNDDIDIYRSRAAVGVRHLFPSRHYSAVRSRLGARGTMTTTSYRSRSAVGVRHFFRRATTLLSGRVLVHAER